MESCAATTAVQSHDARGMVGACTQEDSCPDYMLKAEECLKAEEERVVHYLHASTKAKLLRAVETELLAKYETRLLEKEHSGAAALLRDDKARPCLALPTWRI